MKKRLWSVFLCICMAAMLLPATVFAEETTTAQTLEIGTADQLVAFSEAVNAGEYDEDTSAVVSLTADIDMTGVTWAPIGKSDDTGNIEHFFQGTFCGNGYRIYNLDFSANYGQNVLQGLFGYAGGTTIRDVTVEGTVTLNKAYGKFFYFGTIAAYAEEAEIVNCTAKLSFDNGGYRLSSHTIGGICGYALNTTIDRCENFSTFSLTAESGSGVSAHVGGICADAQSSTVTNCHDAGSAAGAMSYYGGIVSDIWGTTKVQNCYSTGTITVYCPRTHANYFGGIVGQIASTGGNCAVEDCYFAGTINTDQDNRDQLTNIGGVVGGVNADGVTLNNNYSKIQETSKGALPVYGNNTTGGTLKSIDEMKTEAFVTEINNGGGNYIFKAGETPVIPPLTYTITVNNSEGGSGFTDLTAAPVGTEVTLTATPEQAYHFKEWRVDSDNVTIQDNKFIMPYGNVSITAVFEKHYGGVNTCTDGAICEWCRVVYGQATSHVMTKHDKVEATCTTDGKEAYYTCETCRKNFEDEAGNIEITNLDGYGIIPAAGHKAGTEWKSDGTNHWNECVGCGEKMNEAAHDFEWVMDKKATATEAGSRHEQCKICGYKKAAVEIPATGTTTDPTKPNKPDDTGKPAGTTKPDGKTDSTSPQTGDNSNIALWIAVMLAAGAALTGTAIYSRKRKYNR